MDKQKFIRELEKEIGTEEQNAKKCDAEATYHRGISRGYEVAIGMLNDE